MTSKSGRRVGEAVLARKNMDMDVGKLAAAREALGTHTDTETVDRALDYVLFQSEVFSALDRLAEVGGLASPYARLKGQRRGGA